MIGNGFTDPRNQIGHSEFAYQAGLVDQHAKNEMTLFEILINEHLPRPEAKVVMKHTNKYYVSPF